MNLAAILTIYLLSIGSPGPGWFTSGVRGAAAAQQPAGQESSKQQSPPSDTSDQPVAPASGTQSGQPAPTATGSASRTANQAKPVPQRTQRHKKKKIEAPCSGSTTAALDPAPGDPGNATSPTGTGPPTKPCPPPKKVVRNG